MAGADLPGAPKSHAVEGIQLRPQRRRAAIRIDMTPMVDVAFLLLIFFMVTTVFRRPLAMEVNLPQSGAKVEVAESNVLTVFIDKDDAIFSAVGSARPAPISWEGLIPTFEAGVRSNPSLVILVKLHREARYERMVDMMDTLDEAKMQRFSVVPMTDDDVRRLAEAR